MAALLLSGGVLLSFPQAAQAQTPLWSATMTNGNQRGYCSDVTPSGGSDFTCGYGSLSDDGFDYDGTTYTVKSIRKAGQFFHVTFDKDLPADLVSAAQFQMTHQSVTLHYNLDDAVLGTVTSGSIPHNYRWTGTSFNPSLPITLVQNRIPVCLATPDNPCPLIDASLEDITVKDRNDGTIHVADGLNRPVRGAITHYVASAANHVDQVTVEGVPYFSQNDVEYLDGSNAALRDADIRKPGLQVSLEEGTNTIRLKVKNADAMTSKTYNLEVTRRASLKGWFEGIPDSHDGSTAFDVRIRFADDVDSPISNVRAAVSVQNGAASDIAAVGGSTRLYQMTVTPSSGSPVRIQVRGSEGCNASHAICTADNEPFRGLSRWVGTAGETRLRAMWVTAAVSADLPAVWVPQDPAFNPASADAVAQLVIVHDLEDLASVHAVDLGRQTDLTLHISPFSPGVSIAVFGPLGARADGTDRWDSGKTVRLHLPRDVERQTWRVEVTSVNGNSTRTYTMTLHRPGTQTRGDCVSEMFESVTVTPAGGAAVAAEPRGCRSLVARVPGNPNRIEDHQIRGDLLTVAAESLFADATLSLTWWDMYDQKWYRKVPPAQAERRLDEQVFFLRARRPFGTLGGEYSIDSATKERYHNRTYFLRVLRSGGGTTSQATLAEPLMATFEGAPSSHDGATAFTFRLAFSEDVAIEPDAMRDHALLVSGGTVTSAARVNGRNDLWEIAVEPAGSGPMGILVPQGRACAEAGALCTADGRGLSSHPAQSIPYAPPAQEPQADPNALSAAFDDVPSEHNGSTFTFWVRFSEAPAVSFRTLRDEAIAASGGTVRRALRVVKGQNDLWEVHVEPSGHGPVTVTLGPSPACGEAGAVCTADGRALANAPTATVQGPPGLSISDAQVQEGPNAKLAFTVTLSKPSWSGASPPRRHEMNGGAGEAGG